MLLCNEDAYLINSNKKVGIKCDECGSEFLGVFKNYIKKSEHLCSSCRVSGARNGSYKRKDVSDIVVGTRMDGFRSSEDHQVSLVIGDMHVPYQDEYAVELVLTVIDHVQPDKIILNGDIIDWWQMSKFDKNPHGRVRSTQHDADTVHEMIRELGRISPKSDVIYIEGNHEFRIQRYKMRHPELADLRGFTTQEMLRIDELPNVKEYISYGPEQWTTHRDATVGEYWLVPGELMILHGDRTRASAGYLSKAMTDRYSVSGIVGHNHKIGSSSKVIKKAVGPTEVINTSIIFYETGCLCRLNPDWLVFPNWTQGISVVSTYRDSKFFHVDSIPIMSEGSDYKCFVFGRRFNRKGVIN